MENFDELLRKAEKFATRNHGLQDYDGLPYRIANVEHSFKMGHKMMDAYSKEYKDFKYNLQVPNHAVEMWEHLDKLLIPEKV